MVELAVGQDVHRLVVRVLALVVLHLVHVLVQVAGDEHHDAVVGLQTVDQLVAVHDVRRPIRVAVVLRRLQQRVKRVSDANMMHIRRLYKLILS